MKKIQLLTVILTFAASLWLSPSLSMAAEAESAKTKIPETQNGILQEIKVKETALAKTIADKKLSDVHHLAFAIRDLVNALPGKSTGLDPDKQGQLKANAKFVTALAERLDKSGDAGDQVATQANFTKLQDILRKIESFYPGGGK